jgi:hypothetical protein
LKLLGTSVASAAFGLPPIAFLAWLVAILVPAGGGEDG